MAREDTPLDQGVFDATLAAELAKGTDRRVAEGRARSAAVRAYRAAHPEEAAGRRGRARRERRPQRPRQRPRRRAAPAAAAAAAPAAAVAVAGRRVATPVRTAPLPTGGLPTPKKGADDKHRLLALVPPEGIQRVEREQGDRVNVWPHLLVEEFVAMLILSPGCSIFSTFVNAPLRELANPNLTPNPSKAPWYFLGLQELLRYFHPMIAGITIPTFILVGLAAVPYVDRNPSIKPGDRKIAITMFTMLFCSARRSRSSAASSAARATTGSGRGRKGCSSTYDARASPPAVIAAIVVFMVIDMFAIVFGLSFLRAAKEQRAAADGAAPAPKARAPCPRRDFFRESLLTSLARVRRAVRRRRRSRSCGRT